MLVLIRYLGWALVGLLVIGAAANEAGPYETPNCEQLTTQWKTELAPALHVPNTHHQLDSKCESKLASLAYGAELLHRHLPELFTRVSVAKQMVLAGPSPDSSLADTEIETGIISLYDSLLEEKREYIAAQLAHEAAHLRPDDIDHVTCEKGELKGEKEACAAKFTGQLSGDAYNFSYYVLTRLHSLAETSPEIDKSEIEHLIRDLLENNFNEVPETILQRWNATNPLSSHDD